MKQPKENKMWQLITKICLHAVKIFEVTTIPLLIIQKS